MYELLKAVLLDKRTFSLAFLYHTIEMVRELWPKKTIQDNLVLRQSAAKLEEAIDNLSTELMQKMDNLPFKTLEQATKVKEISFKETERASEVILVFSLKKGERILHTNRNHAKLLRACYHVLHTKEMIKESFLEETQHIGTHKNDFENSAIWAFLCSKYWNDFCNDVSLIIDHSELIESINVQKTSNKK